MLAELRAAFTELRDVEPLPQLELPAWLAQGTLWLALDGGCKPLWRELGAPPVNRYIEFCRTVTSRWELRCTQRLAVGDTFVVSAHFNCMKREFKRGGGGTGEEAYNLAYPSGAAYPDTIERREDSHPRPLVWSPRSADDDHVVYAESWEYAVREESRTRVESTCQPGSRERAEARLRSELPSASAQDLAATLLRRHGVAADGKRRCVLPGEELLIRDRHPPPLRFAARIRNMPGEELVDCAEPCPDDQTRHDRFQVYLKDRKFTARDAPIVWVVYASRRACEASTTRSTLTFSNPRRCAQ